jgi:hypothetical protein
MADQTPLEQRKAEASKYRGVSYDARMGKFVAMITINGVKNYLGSFLTAEDASFAYDTERAAHRIERTRTGGAKSVRQLMAEFAENAQYTDDRYKNAVAGQIFTAPDGQRFRLEGFKPVRGKGWYNWSAACRVCGVRFEQETSLKLRSISGMTRNCKEHHGIVHKPVDAPDVWPDPAEWEVAPARGVSAGAVRAKPRRGDAATERTYNKLLDDVWAQIKDDPGLVAEFNHIENVVAIAFSADFYAKNSDADTYSKLAAWLDQPDEPFAALLKKKQAKTTPSARLDDMVLLAEDPPADNDDLL